MRTPRAPPGPPPAPPALVGRMIRALPLAPPAPSAEALTGLLGRGWWGLSGRARPPDTPDTSWDRQMLGWWGLRRGTARPPCPTSVCAVVCVSRCVGRMEGVGASESQTRSHTVPAAVVIRLAASGPTPPPALRSPPPRSVRARGEPLVSRGEGCLVSRAGELLLLLDRKSTV